MQNLFGVRKPLKINAFINHISDDTKASPYPLEVAPGTRRLTDIPLLVGQQLWSLPTPSETLADIAQLAGCHVMLMRDMKDRDLLRSVRCDVSLLAGESVITVHNLIPHVGERTPPLLLSHDGDSMLPLTKYGLTHLLQTVHMSVPERREGVEMAARLLLGLPSLRLAV